MLFRTYRLNLPHPPGHNPHAHVMLTMQAMDERGKWLPKSRKVIDGILASRTDCKECKPVYEKYQKIFFKKTKEKFKQEHPEVARYEKAAAYLAKHPDDKDSTQKELQQEQETLLEEIVVHERIDEDKTRLISIEIHFNFKPIRLFFSKNHLPKHKSIRLIL